MGYTYKYKTYYQNEPGSIDSYMPSYTKYNAVQPTSTYTPTQYSDKTGAYAGDIAQAKAQLASITNNKPGAYTSSYNDRINSLIDKIANRKFQYDVNADSTYQAMKNNYINLGQQAAADTAGQAAALTGGYGNSYATTASNQAYQNYLTQLNDKIPELTQLAMQTYALEGNDLNNLLDIYNTQENTDYSRYRDAISDYQTDRSFYDNAVRNYQSMNQSVWGQNETNKYNANKLAWDNYLNLVSMNDSNYWNAQNIATTRQKNDWDNYWSGIDETETAQQNAWDRASTDYWNAQDQQYKYDTLAETVRSHQANEANDAYSNETARAHYERSDANDAYSNETARTHYTNSDATDKRNASTAEYNAKTDRMKVDNDTSDTFSDGSKKLDSRGDSKTAAIVTKVNNKKISRATLDDYIQRQYENYQLNAAELYWLKEHYGIYY